MEKRIVYADNAATTPLSPAALEAMTPYLTNVWGNPSGIYSVGREAKRGLEDARTKVAAALGAKPEEVYFTGGGTESDNWALKAAAEARARKGKHIITSPLEYHAVTHTLDWLKKQGYEITTLPCDEAGLVDPADLERAIRPDTILVTVMAANNEIGTVEPVRELAAVAKAHGVLFHTDAVQAAGHIPLDFDGIGADFMSVAAHKFRGPKGVGALLVRKGTFLPPFIHGGGQEKNRRSGTENVAGIVGMAAALEEAVENLETNTRKLNALRARLDAGLLQLPYSRRTGHPTLRLPGTASYVFECIEGESLVLSLDAAGICASSGSACSSASLDPSHVLLAIGLRHDVAHGSLRLSLGEQNTKEDVDYILGKLPPIVERLRAMSPLWEDRLNGRY